MDVIRTGKETRVSRYLVVADNRFLLALCLAMGIGFNGCKGEPSAEVRRNLTVSDASARREAVRSLGKQAIGGQVEVSSAVKQLIEKLQDSDPGVRAVALAYLGQLRADPPLVVPLIAAALQDPSPLVRMNAGQALRLYGEKAASAVPQLLNALNDLDGDTRRAAAIALAYHPANHYDPPSDYSTLAPDAAAEKVKAMGTSPNVASLFRAAQDGDVAVVFLLLKSGLDPNVREDRTQRTPLMVAGAHPDVVRVLLAAGADVNAQCDSGTALFSAAIASNPYSVRLLLDAKVDVRARKSTGETALSYVGSGTPQQDEVRKLLVAAGAVP